MSSVPSLGPSPTSVPLHGPVATGPSFLRAPPTPGPGNWGTAIPRVSQIVPSPVMEVEDAQGILSVAVAAVARVTFTPDGEPVLPHRAIRRKIEWNERPKSVPDRTASAHGRTIIRNRREEKEFLQNKIYTGSD